MRSPSWSRPIRCLTWRRRGIKQQLGLGSTKRRSGRSSNCSATPTNLADNLIDYLSGFSKNIDVFAEFKFDQTIHELAEKDRLLIVVQAFAKVDLSPATVDNAVMGAAARLRLYGQEINPQSRPTISSPGPTAARPT